ncbi:hypothetical protein HYW46_06285 [Candidatus Daviesbacteria bacterium]|nr:hypothetical protein [Candidatus Daviesbacteria bacterium]
MTERQSDETKPDGIQTHTRSAEPFKIQYLNKEFVQWLIYVNADAELIKLAKSLLKPQAPK